ncbi:MAG: GAF domain-containing protein, partial [Armatimonadetes bacterium]|nr:GAF domain-containing protein [Armatimonadota bacterium]
MTTESPDGVAGRERRVELLERQIDAVHSIAAAFSSKIEVDALLRETLRVSLDTVGAGAGSIILYDREKKKLVFRYVLPEDSAGLLGLELEPDGNSIAGSVFTSGEFRISADVTKEKAHRSDVGERIGHVTHNMVTAPLKSREGAPIGVMQVLNKHEGMFNEDDCELLDILSALAATLLENARLAEEAKLAVVVNLLGDISHDIKNMVTPVQTCAQTLEMMFDETFADLDAALQGREDVPPEAVEGVNSAVEMLRDFYPDAIEMLLDGSAQVQDRVREIADCVKGIVAQPTFELQDVRGIAAKVIQALTLVGEKADVTVALDVPDDLPPAPVDQKQLYNAIYNLVNNAIPETPAGGSVTAKLSAIPDGEFPDGKCLVIEVVD